MTFSMAATRRVFLSGALQALAASAFMANGCAPQKDGASAGVFTPQERKAFAAVADTFIPHGGAFEIGAVDVDVASRADRILAAWDSDVLTGMRGALQFVEHQSAALIGAEGLFSALDAPAREKVFSTMLATEDVPAQIYSALKFVVCTFFITADAVWPSVGYPGSMLGGN